MSIIATGFFPRMTLLNKVYGTTNGKDTTAYLAEYRDDSPVVLSWDQLVVTSKTKTLLKSVKGQICGGCWAIMGSSGSGKTTLLSTLALRLNSRWMSITGEMRINGRPYTKHVLKKMSGYVMQDDLLDGNFTVLETLEYSARLRMSASTGNRERQRRIEEVLRLLDIGHVRDVFVGDTRRKGVSGGERKRLCIAMELLADPKLLFLDEPTSGLDSFTAMSVMARLKTLSRLNGCTVVSTIHQPSSQCFQLFDSLLLMSRGRIVYQGSAAKVLSYFDALGFPCPSHTNPSDHVILVLASDPAHERRRLKASRGTQQMSSDAVTDRTSLLKAADCHEVASARANAVEMVIGGNTSRMRGILTRSAGTLEPRRANQMRFRAEKNIFDVEVDLLLGEDKEDFRDQPYEGISWLEQFRIIFQRAVHGHLRRWDVLALNIVVTLVIAGFVCSSVWHDIGTGKSSASRRQPALFFCVIHQGIVASMQGTNSFPMERALMLRERATGAYTVSAYFVAKTVADILVMQLLPPVLFSCVVYPAIGFAPGGEQFLTFILFMILTSMAATSLANLAACLCVGVERATVLLAAAYEISRLYGAWFISPALMSSYSDWRFADTLSYIKYSYVGVSLNENLHLLLTCAPDELTKTTSADGSVAYSCIIPPLNKPPYSGDAYNSYFGFDQFSIGSCIGALILYIFSCRLLAYLALRTIKM